MLVRALTIVATLVLGVVATSSSAFACGCKPPVKKVHVNAGVGNGAEFGRTEAKDRDPGRSGSHNQAGMNSFKPNSAAASMP